MICGNERGNKVAVLGELKDVVIARDRTTSEQGILLMGPQGLNDLILTQLEPGPERAFSDPSVWNLLRLRHGWPLFGIDIKTDQLPQEVDRDKLAINFNKGCYLGQETVARLDALGHVNRMLMGFKWQPGCELNPATAEPLEIQTPENQNVGEIRSFAFDESIGQWIGQALVRVKALAGPLHVQDDPAGKITFYRLAELR